MSPVDVDVEPGHFSRFEGRPEDWPGQSRLLFNGRLYVGPSSDAACRGTAIMSYCCVLLLFVLLASLYVANWVLTLCTASIICMSLAAFMLTGFVDPGVVPRSAKPKPQVNPGERFCKVCSLKQVVGMHHCRQCNVCVRELDHHCSVTGNCIGARNSIFFVCMTATLSCAIYALVAVVALAVTWHACEGCRDSVDIVAWVLVAMELVFISSALYHYASHWFACLRLPCTRRRRRRGGRPSMLRTEIPRVHFLCCCTIPETLLAPSRGTIQSTVAKPDSRQEQALRSV